VWRDFSKAFNCRKADIARLQNRSNCANVWMAEKCQNQTWLDGIIALESGVPLWKITPPTARLCASCRGRDCRIDEFGTFFAVMAVFIYQYAVLTFICRLQEAHHAIRKIFTAYCNFDCIVNWIHRPIRCTNQFHKGNSGGPGGREETKAAEGENYSALGRKAGRDAGIQGRYDLT
jgi:hypothetical protein